MNIPLTMDYTKKQQLRYIKQFQKNKEELKTDCHKLWREICFLKAKGKCEYPKCYNPATQPHHIKTKGGYPHLKYDPENSMALCYYHHDGGRYGAHHDINFKEIIIKNGVRTKEFFDKLERKADKGYKLDLELEFLYLTKLKQELTNK